MIIAFVDDYKLLMIATLVVFPWLMRGNTFGAQTMTFERTNRIVEFQTRTLTN